MRLTEEKVVSRKCLPDVRHKVGDALAPGQWQAIALFPELTIKCQKSISVSEAQWRGAGRLLLGAHTIGILSFIGIWGMGFNSLGFTGDAFRSHESPLRTCIPIIG